MKYYMGKILIVDLTAGTVSTEEVPQNVFDAVLTGKGLAAWYLYKNIPAGADPLGPDNILAFMSGALTGTGALVCGRWTVCCKSPLTGGWGDASCGGVFSPAIKQCGYDGIFFKGISEKPVYLFCDNNHAELRDASEYWGMDAVDAEIRIREDIQSKKRPCVAVIGTAGENCSLVSGIVNEGGRIAARSGVGAVMGSKRLKAVALAGSRPIPCADKEAVKALSKELGTRIKKIKFPSGVGGMLGLGGSALGYLPSMPLPGPVTTLIFRHWGTPSNTPLAIKSGDGPIMNWAGGPREAKGMTRDYNPDVIKRREIAKYHCYSCPLGCGGRVKMENNPFSKYTETHKPEYETIECFGPLLLNRDLDSVMAINEMLSRGGMDSISAGNIVAWAIECYEKGIITKEQTGGLELTWGNSASIVKLVEQMINRTGFGADLTDGVKRASEKYGGKEFAMHVGGQEPGMHDTRYDPQLGVHMVTEPAPGKHTVGMAIQYGAMSLWDICSWAPKVGLHLRGKDYIPNEKLAMISKANACYSMLTEGTGGCYYAEMMGVHMWKLIEYLNAALGWNYYGDHYMEIGERIQNLRQLFNLKQGFDPAAVVLPERMKGNPPLSNGPLKGRRLRTPEQVALHWKAFGWDPETGVPLEETLERLGIPALLEE